jgi:hypothetical protein
MTEYVEVDDGALGDDAMAEVQEIVDRETFDRWMRDHDAKLVAEIVSKVRMNCTPSAEAYARGGDFLVASVAGWIESPPRWVNAGWPVERYADDPERTDSRP